MIHFLVGYKTRDSRSTLLIKDHSVSTDVRIWSSQPRVAIVSLTYYERPSHQRLQNLASSSRRWGSHGSPNALEQPLCSQMDFFLDGPGSSRAVRRLSSSSLPMPPLSVTEVLKDWILELCNAFNTVFLEDIFQGGDP